ncbi:MAG: DUF1080 domain-containing protein, partial [Planctomycetaceae bacterium]|nr:DUF1080 domain-containing protein [Planctomycetaceae bacterium]
SRYLNLGYPIRSMRTPQYLYVRNFRPERWPAGAPQKFDGDKPGPEYGGYHDIDACPTLDHLIELRDDPTYGKYLHWAVDHRPAVEIFDVTKDRDCLQNLAGRPEFARVEAELTAKFDESLRTADDPRVVARDGGDVFETYRRFSGERRFPEADWAAESRQQRESAGWIRLFDGETLDGWKVAGPKDSFAVINGAIQAAVPPTDSSRNMAHLYYVGPDEAPGTADDDFRDFELQIECMSTPGSNGGVYFHTSWQEQDFPNDGHEMQVNTSHQNKTRTGSLFGVVDLHESAVPDNVFFTEHLTVRGKHVTIAVEGQTVVDYTEPEGYSHPRYAGRNVDHGTFALQAHDPQSVTYYREIWLRRISDER